MIPSPKNTTNDQIMKRISVQTLKQCIASEASKKEFYSEKRLINLSASDGQHDANQRPTIKMKPSQYRKGLAFAKFRVTPDVTNLPSARKQQMTDACHSI
jgi:hypothetical protein